MTLYRVIYACEDVIMETSCYMPIEDCLREQKRFNNLPMMDLERQAMTASIEDIEI